MDIDVNVDGKSLTLNIENPFRIDMDGIMSRIIEFGRSSGVDLSLCGIDELIPRMIKGVAGCEAGCPADARSVVREGFRNYRLSYVEGGILTAEDKLENGVPLVIKVFPEF
jgi:hypothetical protein